MRFGRLHIIMCDVSAPHEEVRLLMVWFYPPCLTDVGFETVCLLLVICGQESSGMEYCRLSSQPGNICNGCFCLSSGSAD